MNDFTYDFIYEHLIEEICELFKLDIEKSKIIKNICNSKTIDKDEIIDVINLLWMLDYKLKN